MKRNASLLLCIFTIGLLTTALPASPRAAVLHKVSVVKEHPRFSIVFVESNTPFKKYDFRSSTGRADYVELDLYGVSQGDVADRIRRLNRCVRSDIQGAAGNYRNIVNRCDA